VVSEGALHLVTSFAAECAAAVLPASFGAESEACFIELHSLEF